MSEVFPSPYGDFVFQRGAGMRFIADKYGVVSVPLRGFCFSTIPSEDQINDFIWLFPSPYGDFVFQQSLRKALSFLT